MSRNLIQGSSLERTQQVSNKNLDPYQLIQILNKKIKSQQQSITWYKKMLQTSQYQKKITLTQLKKKKQSIQQLKIQFSNQKQQRKDYELQLQQLRSKFNKIQKVHNLSHYNNQNTTKLSTTILRPSFFQSPNLSTNFNSNSQINQINNSKQLINSLSVANSHVRVWDNRPLPTVLSLELKSTKNLYNFNKSPIGGANRVLQEKNRNISLSEEQFIPSDIKLVERTNHKFSFANSSSASFLNTSSDLMNQTNMDEPISQNPAEFFFEDFLVLGPDVSELKKKRNQSKDIAQIQIKPAVLYAGNGKYPTQQTYTQIASRCFPFNNTAKRQYIESYQDIRSIIQFKPLNKISNDCLIFNLKGQISSTAKQNRLLRKSNINEIQFIFCLKLPDFVWIAKQQKHYQRPEQQIWIVQKYYAIVTYYPFFQIHLNILLRIHQILMKQKLEKILLQNKQKYHMFDIRRNMLDLEKNEQAKRIIEKFKMFTAESGDKIWFDGHYYGSVPSIASSEDGNNQMTLQIDYAIAKIAAPIFMTNFSFEQMFLMITAILCQKTIIIMSKNQGIASLCAMFLVNIISPFPYSYFIMLNADQSKLVPIIFQYPFPMIATLKKTSKNIASIFQLYASSVIQKKDIKQQSERLILVDADTNTIYYQGPTSFHPLILHPGQQLQNLYMKVNSCPSKSFSFPKPLIKKIEAQKYNKRHEQKIKLIQNLQHTMKVNHSKLPSFQSNQEIQTVLYKIIDYLGLFLVEGYQLQQALRQLNNGNGKYHHFVMKQLMEKMQRYASNNGKQEERKSLLKKVVSSQYYADFLNLVNGG